MQYKRPIFFNLTPRFSTLWALLNAEPAGQPRPTGLHLKLQGFCFQEDLSTPSMISPGGVQSEKGNQSRYFIQRDVGFNFTSDGGKEKPHRGREANIPPVEAPPSCRLGGQREETL